MHPYSISILKAAAANKLAMDMSRFARRCAPAVGTVLGAVAVTLAGEVVTVVEVVPVADIC